VGLDVGDSVGTRLGTSDAVLLGATMVGEPVGVDDGDTAGDFVGAPVGPLDAVIVGATEEGVLFGAVVVGGLVGTGVGPGAGGVLFGAVVVGGLVGTGVGPGAGGRVGASDGDGVGFNSPWIALSTLTQKALMLTLTTSPFSSN
jgi:hypothetical protein